MYRVKCYVTTTPFTYLDYNPFRNFSEIKVYGYYVGMYITRKTMFQCKIIKCIGLRE